MRLLNFGQALGMRVLPDARLSSAGCADGPASVTKMKTDELDAAILRAMGDGIVCALEVAAEIFGDEQAAEENLEQIEERMFALADADRLCVVPHFFKNDPPEASHWKAQGRALQPN